MLTIYHGSSEIVSQPVFGKGKLYNDYGRGFYCTEHCELAKEWACTEAVDGYANCYQLDTSKLNILDLTDNRYTILHWLALLVEYRRFRLSTPLMKRGAAWLKENFCLPIEEYDVVIGYRADDSYFAFARAFLNNEISLQQLSCAMRLGNLGTQVVLKSEKAFQEIRFVSCEIADNAVYYSRRSARDQEARAAYIKVLEQEDIEGSYLNNIIREGLKEDDARIS